jgi:hypothetical protein
VKASEAGRDKLGRLLVDCAPSAGFIRDTEKTQPTKAALSAVLVISVLDKSSVSGLWRLIVPKTHGSQKHPAWHAHPNMKAGSVPELCPRTTQRRAKSARRSYP